MADDEPKPASKTERLLQLAAQIDPDAWATPMRSRHQARRNRSYQEAVREYERSEQKLQRSRL